MFVLWILWNVQYFMSSLFYFHDSIIIMSYSIPLSKHPTTDWNVLSKRVTERNYQRIGRQQVLLSSLFQFSSFFTISFPSFTMNTFFAHNFYSFLFFTHNKTKLKKHNEHNSANSGMHSNPGEYILRHNITRTRDTHTKWSVYAARFTNFERRNFVE